MKDQLKILLMPSWYPNSDQPVGSFFLEQARFLQENGYDIKVLMGEYLHTKSYAFHKLKRNLFGKSNAISKSFLEQDPEAFSFPTIIQKSWSEQKKIEIANRNYLKGFEQIKERGWSPDVIHVQGVFRAGFAAHFISSRYKIPFVIIEHAPFRIAAYSNYVQQKVKETLLAANKVAGVSHYHKKRMEEDGINRSIEVVWNLMDENQFQLKSDASSNKFIITCIARPAKVKDMNTFFKALIKFLNSIDDISSVEVNIVGHASIEENRFVDLGIFDKLENKEQILSSMNFFSFLTRDKINPLLQNSDVLVATSTDEPYGVSIREAMLCGTPVISTKSGGPEDSITQDTGVLVEIGDFEGIADYLNKLKDKELSFDYSYIRDYIINQSGRKAFKKRMDDFYNCTL